MNRILELLALRKLNRNASRRGNTEQAGQACGAEHDGAVRTPGALGVTEAARQWAARLLQPTIRK